MYYMDIDDDCLNLFSFHHSNADLNPPRTSDEAIALSQLWYRVSLAELTNGDYMGNAKLSTIQTIAVLTLVNNSFGENEREYHFIGAAINMARNLDMHNLGQEPVRGGIVRTKPQFRTPEDRALGRRLWWTLVICDWYDI